MIDQWYYIVGRSTRAGHGTRRNLCQRTNEPYHSDFIAELFQDGVRIHTISRTTGKVRVWHLPTAFFANYGNAFDTEGVCYNGGIGGIR